MQIFFSTVLTPELFLCWCCYFVLLVANFKETSLMGLRRKGCSLWKQWWIRVGGTPKKDENVFSILVIVFWTWPGMERKSEKLFLTKC